MVKSEMVDNQRENSPPAKEFNDVADLDNEQLLIDKESEHYWDNQHLNVNFLQEMYKIYYAFTDQNPYRGKKNQLSDISNISLGERTLAKNPDSCRGLSSVHDDLNFHYKVSSNNTPEYRSNKPSPNNAPSDSHCCYHKISRHNIPVSRFSKKTSPHNIAASAVIDKTSLEKPHDKTIEHNQKRGSAVDIMVSSESWVTDACSCANCDSYHCFALRYQSGFGCCCKECKHSHSCLFYNQLEKNLDLTSKKDINKKCLENILREAKPKLSKSTIQDTITVKKPSSTSLMEVPSGRLVPTPCNTCKPKIPLDDYELHKKRKKSLGHPIREKDAQDLGQGQNEEFFTLVKEYVYRELHKINAVFRSAVAGPEVAKLKMEPTKVDVSTSKSTGILNRITNIFGVLYNSRKTQTFDNKDKASSVINIDIEENDVANTEAKIFFSDCNADSKDKTCKPDKIIYNEIIEDIEKQLLEMEGDIENTPSFNFKTPAADLQAQIMNIYYRENPPRRRPVKNVFDLFERIKAAYDVCSCKVCECIGIDPEKTKMDQCKCKPCDCNDCNNVKKSGCLPKGLACLKKYSVTDCHCKVCQCVDCGDSIPAPCSCRPCECVKCKSKDSTWIRSQRFVVATAHERPSCTCDPCGCGQCTFRCNTSNAQARHTLDIGTDQCHHLNCICDSCANANCAQDGVDSCTCDIYAKLMRKPCVKDTSEYDIRSALDCKKDKHASKKITVHDILTMFSVAPDQLCSIDYDILRAAPKIKIQSQDLANVNSTSTANVCPLISDEFIDFIVPDEESKNRWEKQQRKNNIMIKKDKSYYTFTDREVTFHALSNVGKSSFKEIGSAEEKQDCRCSPDNINEDPNYPNSPNNNPECRFRKPLPTNSPAILRYSPRTHTNNSVSGRSVEDSASLTKKYSQRVPIKDDYRMCDTNNVMNIDFNPSKLTTISSFKKLKLDNDDKSICIQENKITPTVCNQANKMEYFVPNEDLNIFDFQESRLHYRLNKQKNCSSVKRTLQESKQFSLQLLKKLQIYKQSNRNLYKI